jgi:hypothetical protein
MKTLLIILLITCACIGCANSNVYSRGETPLWYEYNITECDKEKKGCLA